MKLLIKTVLSKNYRDVYNNFDLELFKALKPPLMQLEVLRFDGCLTGHEVHLEIGLGLFKQKWVSIITDHIQDERECSFIDEGRVLPLPLKSWRHNHKILKIDEHSCEIHDDIDYSTGSYPLDLILYPVLYLQFSIRPGIYREYFKKL